jgi:hypothetical protein
MHNLLSHLIHLTVITEFEVLFYIYYIVPYERQSINHMFDYKLPSLNISATPYINCSNELKRMNTYNDKLVAICYYYIGAINLLLLGAFIYDVYKVCKPNASLPRVLSSPKSWIQMIDFTVTETADTIEPKESEESLIKKYWNQSRFVAKMCETLQLIVLLGIFEYLFFAYLFNKFKIVSAKLIVCGILNN